MIWVIVFAAIGLAGLVTAVCCAVWLAHKTSDLFSEVRMLGTRLGELSELMASVKFPGAALEADDDGAGTLR